MVRLKDPVEVRTSRSSVRDAVGMSTPPARPSSSNETHGTIVVVEDDRNISDLVDLYLRNAGFRVLQAGDAARGLELVAQEKPYLVLLDIGLPGAMDGLELCRALRRTSDVPVIIITARDDEVDRVLGLELGADDYLTKPFSPRELVARVRAVLRRTEGARRPSEEPVIVGEVTVDTKRREVSTPDGPVTLTAREFDLLTHFAENPGIVYTRQQLLDAVWGSGWYGDERTVDVHVRQLRRKLGDALPLTTIWGVGYRCS
jgi:DNA-binding response OmpR family regulator